MNHHARKYWVILGLVISLVIIQLFIMPLQSIVASGPGTVTITNSTFSDNSAPTGAGILAVSGTVTINNTIIANSTGNNCSGTLLGSNNLADDATCTGGFTNSGAIGLEPLADNGGSSETHAISSTSSAFNAGDNDHLNETIVGEDLNGNGVATDNLATGFDQRGTPFNRVEHGAVDIGAFEGLLPCPSFPVTATTPTELAFYIDCANATATTDTINISGTISLTAINNTIDGNNGLPSITMPIIINGNGNTVTRSSASNFRIFHVGSGGTLELNDATVSNGSASFGGGIYNSFGTVIVFNSTISGNSANSGGGIYNEADTLTVSNSIISGNTASSSHGGGILNEDTLILTNSIISGNSAAGNGGGIYSEDADTEIVNSTISGNSAAGFGGGISNDIGDTMTVNNSIVWGNDATTDPQIENGGTLNLAHTGIDGGVGSLGGTVNNNGGNLDLSSSDDIFVDPFPASTTATPNTLGDYHLTQTSVVVNAASNTIAINAGLTTDIDGEARIAEGIVDMGADEIQTSCASLPFPYTASTTATLIFAMDCANLTAATDTINISGTISLTAVDNVHNGNNGLPNIVTPMIINGNGNIIERSSALTGSLRIFHIGTGGDLTANNLIVRNGLEANGGAVSNWGVATFNGVSFLENTATNWGGAIYNATGFTLNVNDSYIQGNSATVQGGGFYNGSSNGTIINTIISGNYADDGGGWYTGSGGTTTVINSTIAGNHANTGGGFASTTAITVNLSNSVVWGNDAITSDPQIRNAGIINFRYVGLEGGIGSLSGTNNNIEGNVTLSASDDVFVAPEPASNTPTIAGDYHLTQISVVVNAASNTIALNAGLTTDIDGEARIAEGTVDMGADEIQTSCASLPFPYTASTTATLIFAIECANLTPATDTINISGTMSLTAIDNVTDGSNGLPSIKTPIIIEGAGNTVERSGAITATFRLFHVGVSGTLELNDTTLSNGSAQDTGASASDDDGGAIFNWGVLEVNNSLLEDNTASDDGGAIFNNGGTVSISGTSTISGNVADFGGAIYNTNSGIATVTNSTLSGNSASVNGGAIYNSSGTATVTNSILSGNATGGVGGAIYNNSSATVTNSTLSGNSAGFGGVIFNGGGTATVTNSTLSGNSANQGGAIRNDVGTTTVTNSVVWGNDATIDPQIDNNATLNVNYSGVQDLASVNVSSGANNLDLSSTDDVFVDPEPASSAPTTDGDYHLTQASVVINAASNTIAINAGLTMDIDGEARIAEGTVDMGADEIQNSCATYPFPATASTTATLILAINCANTTPATDTINISGTMSLTAIDNTTNGDNGLPSIKTPIIINGNGNTIERAASISATISFRIFHVGTSGTLELNDATLTNGSANSGGGIFNGGGTVTVTGSTLGGNSAGDFGGAIFNFAGTATVTVTNSTLSGNSAGTSGGGIYSDSGTITVTNSTLNGNSAGDLGGAIFNFAGTATVTNSMLSGNSATLGGALYNTNTLTVTNSTLSGNSAGDLGGAILNNAGVVTVTNSIVWGNDATSDPQIDNNGTLNLHYSGVEDLASVVVNTGSNNLDLSSSDDIFVDPFPASTTATPNTLGDYHLSTFSPVINQGDNASVPVSITTDIDGDARILEGTVDMGADESTRCDGFIFPATVSTPDELRLAINCANATPATDTINISGTMSLTAVDNTTDGNNGLPSITTPIIIEGTGNTVERSGAITATFRLFYVGVSGTLELNDITLSNGSAQDTDGGINTDDAGGAIFNNGGAVNVSNSTLSGNSATTGGSIFNTGTGGTLTVTNSTLSGNSASGFGGGITNNIGTVSVVNSTLSGNSATTGGGIFNTGGTLTVTNSTLSGNSASNVGGGILNSSGGTVSMSNSTLSSNSASNIGGGIFNDFGGTVTVENSVIWGNDATTSDPQIDNNGTLNVNHSGVEDLSSVSGTTDLGGNIDLSSSDDVFVDPVSPASAPTDLGDYHLSTLSVVINKGSNALLPADTFDLDGDSNTAEPLPIDIDGDDRVVGANVDMGADEVADLCLAIAFPYTATNASELILAITCANATIAEDVIYISGTISLTAIDNVTDGNNGLPGVINPLVIIGNGIIGDSVIERDAGAGDTFRIIHNTSDLKLFNLIIRNGSAQNTDASATDDDGGGIFNSGNLETTSVIISGNRAAGVGGGIYTVGANLTLYNSTVAGNFANFAGGIRNFNATVSIFNTIVWGNGATTSAPQIATNNSFNVHNSGVQDLASVTGVTLVGTNIDLESTASIFVSPVSATLTPNNLGDYHINATFANPVVNAGENTQVPTDTYDIDGDANTGEQLPIDFDGDNRISDAIVDMGADEVDICSTISFPYTANTANQLRTAIECANLTPATDTIRLGANITLTEIDNVTDGNNGLPVITSPIIIGGQGRFIQRSAAISDTFRLFHVATSGTLSIFNATLTNGSAQDTGAGTHDDAGGTILNRGLLTLTNSNVSNASAEIGAGIYNLGDMTLANVALTGNSAGSSGGFYNRNGTALIMDSTITGNSASVGGGFRAFLGDVTIKDTLISENSATLGGGFYNGGSAHVTIINTNIRGNSADNGGGIRNTATLDIVNSIVSGNHVSGAGGAIFNNTGDLTITNSSISGNFANDGGGIYNNSGSNLTLYNSIVSGNEALSNPQIRNLASATVSYSGIEGGFTGIGNINLSSADALFVAAQPAASAPTTLGDYHLSANSVVINQGLNSLATGAGLTTDIDGQARIQLGRVDMGADEITACPTFPATATTGNQLRMLIACANRTVASDTINISGTMTLTSIADRLEGNNGLPTIYTPIIINGAGNIIERSSAISDSFRIFRVSAAGSLELHDAILRNGFARNTDGTTTNDDDGGAILVRGSLTTTNVIMSGNRATSVGGAIFTANTPTTILLTHTTIAGNRANYGGGIRNFNSTTRLNNSLVWGNNAPAGAPQIGNNAAVQLANTGIENLAGVAYSDFGGIQNLSSTDNLFVDPRRAHVTATPNTLGDYHLSTFSVAIDAGFSPYSAGIPTDIDGDTRIINGTPDMGADENTACLGFTFPATASTATELRLAIDCANGTPATDTITLTSNITLTEVDNTSLGNNGLPVIVTPIVIEGANNTIARSGAIPTTFRFFYVANGGHLTLNETTLSNGSAQDTASNFADDDGGAIVNHGTLIITNSTLSNNTALEFGGAINSNNGDLTLINSTITGNSADFGGGFSNLATATIINSTIHNNTASNGAGITNLGTLTIINTIMSGNAATNSGGGIYNFGAPGVVTMLNSTLSGNYANNGGGIANNTTVTLTNSLVWGNDANTNPNIANSSSFNITYSGVEDLASVAGVTDNGGNLNLSSSATVFVAPEPASNAPTAAGDYHISLLGPVLDKGNTTLLPTDSLDIDGDSNISETLPLDIDGDARVIGSAVDMGADESAGCLGITFPITVTTAYDLRAAIVCANATPVADIIRLGANIVLTEIDNNTDGDNGLPRITSPITLNGQGNTLSRSNAISETFRLLHVGTTGNLYLYNISLTNGDADDGNVLLRIGDRGGALLNEGIVTLHTTTISGNHATHLAGGLYNIRGGVMTITNSTLTNNTAMFAAGLFNDRSQVNITGSTVTSNLATSSGGGLYNSTDGIMTIATTTISGNSASLGYGAGVFATNNGVLSITNSTIRGNGISTVLSGGGLYNHNGSTATIMNSFINGNRASHTGGAVFNAGATTTMTLINTTIAGNKANANGGGIVNTDSATMTLHNSLVWGNAASMSASSNQQIHNVATLLVQNSGVQNLATAVFTDNGGNLNLNPTATVFAAPQPASIAPTLTGDYHLANLSPAVNTGSNSLVPVSSTTDIDGDNRVINGVVDMGADERAFDLPPVDTNLVYNPGFSLGVNGDAGWDTTGSLQKLVTGGVMNLRFATTVNGWLQQFRAIYPLQANLKMIGWVVVSNPDPVAKNFQLAFRDSDLSQNVVCTFTIPASVSNATFSVRFLTQTPWEIIRIDMRPQSTGGNGLNFDNVNLRYRPTLTIVGNQECVTPVFPDENIIPPDTNIVSNDVPVGDAFNATLTNNPPSVYGGNEGGCSAIDWFNTDNWKGYLPTSEVQFIFDPFPEGLVTAMPLQNPPSVYGGNEGGIYDANGDGVADTLYDALSYNGHGHAVSLLREAVIAMLHDRYDSNHPESWWAVEIDTAEALAQGEHAMLALAQRYAISNASCK